LVKQAAEVLGENFDIEIIEKHHNQKVDAPSGTALMLADSANSAFDGKKPYVNGREGQVGKRGNEIGIHAVRGGTIVGEHDVMFCGEDEVITLSHAAHSKKVFAAGAIKAAKWLAGKPAGKYDMKNVLANLNK
jgi:4-hydroxy-tetrahydrodipicolinate reductase